MASEMHRAGAVPGPRSGSVGTTRRATHRIAGDRESQAIASTLGGQVALARRRLRLSQGELGRRVGVTPSRIGQIERGRGAGAPLGLWVALGMALDRPLAVGFSRDLSSLGSGPADGAHLELQEFLLGLARRTGRRATFELATRSAEPWRSTDVGIRDDRHRVLILAEAWNTIGDVGAARRSTNRKVAEAAALAAALGGERRYRVASVWVVRPTAANRAIVTRSPDVFRSAFPGPSLSWVRALAAGAEPPEEPGLVWCDPASGRLVAWRRRV